MRIANGLGDLTRDRLLGSKRLRTESGVKRLEVVQEALGDALLSYSIRQSS